jgi:hypothetical protein
MTRKQFEQWRREGNYTTMGWEFWTGFLACTGNKRVALEEMWKSLSKAEKAKCESC